MNHRLPMLWTLMSLLLLVGPVGAADSQEPEASKDKMPAEIVWNDYDAGLKMAKEQDKHVFVNFTTSWCGYCKKMDKTTFVDPDVLKMFYENFVAVKVDGDSKRELDIDGYKIAERNLTRDDYGVGSYPTYWFLTPSGERLGSLRGYQFKDQLMKFLTYVAERQYDTTAAKDGK
ncbi:MAG: thioredoxin family protein [bacterium]